MPTPNQKLSSVRLYENLRVPDISQDVNKNLVAGKGRVTGASEVSLELRETLVLATFTPIKGKTPVVVGIPLAAIQTMIFAN